MNIKSIIEYRKKTILACCIFIVASSVIAFFYMISNICAVNYPQELTGIDSLCDTHPYIAKAKLKDIAYKYNKEADENNWYYRFLVLKAAVKSNEDCNNSSEINDVVKFYEKSGNKELLPQVYYCAGCIYRNLKDITSSNQYFLKCLEIVKDTQNKVLLPLCNYQLGYNFSMQSLYKEALPYQIKSLFYHKKYNNKSRILSDYEELAWTYGNMGNKDKAFEYIKKANVMAYSIRDTSKISETECQLAIHNMEFSRLNQARKHIDIALAYPNGNNKSALYSTALEIYSKLGIIEKAKTFCDSTINIGNIYGKKYAYWWLALYNNRNGEQFATHDCIQKYKDYSDSVSNALSAEASAKANALYNYNIREKENIALRNENTIQALYIAVILSLLIIVVLLSVTIYKRIGRKKSAIEKRYNMLVALREKEQKSNENIIKEKEREIEDIKKMLSLIKEQNSQKKAELGNALILREKQLHEINNDMVIKRLSDISLRKSDVYKRIMCLSANEGFIKFDDWDDLRQTIFNTYSSFEDKLSELCPMNDTELKTCLLIRIGINSTKIASFLNKSPHTIYSISRRLYYKNFGESVAPSEWEKFIRAIY